MKKTDLVKFSLTLVSASVLAACSSGGSKKAAEPAPAPTPEPKVQTPVEKYGAAAKSYGHQFVQKTDSNADVGLGLLKDSKSSKAFAMTRALDADLDTIVVAQVITPATETTPETKSVLYLDRFNLTNNATDNGEYTLSEIFKTENGHTTAGTKEGAAPVTANQSGKVLVFKQNETNYTNRAVKNTVAEVYGHKSTAANSAANAPFLGYATVDMVNRPNNSEAKELVPTVAGKLNFVQYGRVTSKLHSIALANLVDGDSEGLEVNTKKVSFGDQGTAGTEDNYFYRSGLAVRDGVDLEKVKAALEAGRATNSTELTYLGHAVTFGLDHTRFHTDNSKAVPNTVKGASNALYSGTHVKATIKLADGEVKGSLFDLWAVNGERGYQENHLVKFEGALNKTGAIQGKSNLAYGSKSEGTFNANLFRADEKYDHFVNGNTELGGAVKSNAQEGGWGAVFGLKQQALGTTPTPEAPKREVGVISAAEQ